MRLHRFFTPEPIGNRSELTIESRELVDQLRRVFRLKAGDEIVLFDGSGSDYKGAIARFDGADRVVLEHLTPSPSRYMPIRQVSLYTAVVKKDNFETIVEKATELGVTDIVPVLADRSEKKSLNMERLRKIAVEASEQSGRGNVPNIWPIEKLAAIVGRLSSHEHFTLEKSHFTKVKFEPAGGEPFLALAFHTEGELLARSHLGISRCNLAVFIGPEGGWSPDELALFHKAGISVYCLGPQVLRAETAAIAALTMAVFGS
ncbi:MAG: 16S rRNA (uracil(1498)-N(3))-methyltransferase [Patescibacteria group bacterium]|nr:16S rRNA (uracil(1498)-N(3))-methyltransferase [Patescibacteria group bacterium]